MTTKMTPVAASPSPSAPKFKKGLARSMVFALLMFAVIPVLIMGIAGYARARKLLYEQVAQQIYNISHSYASDLNRSMTTKKIRLDRVSRRPLFIESAEKLSELAPSNASFIYYREQLFSEFDVVNRPDSKPLFENFMLVNTDGVVCAASQANWEGLSLANSEHYPEFITGAHSTGIYDVTPILPEQFAIFTIKPLSAENGKDIGLLIGLTESESAEAFLNKIIFFNPASSAYFIASNEAYVGIDAYTKELAVFEPSHEQKQIIASTMIYREEDERDTLALLEFSNYQETPVVAQVHWMPAVNSGIVLEIPQNVALGQLGSLAPFSILIFILTFGAMSVVLWIASNRVVKPLLDLAATTRHFSEGDWQRRSPIQRDDEIGLLAHSFNKMADELSSLYRSLEDQVNDRTEYIRAAAEVAQSIVSTFDVDELLRKTTRLIVERFDYYHAGIFMIDRAGKMAVLKTAYGPSADEMLEVEHRLAVGSPSIVGWVTANNQPRAASDVGEDPVHFKNKLLPQTRAEVCIPIAIGDLVLGALDVQSTQPEAFDQGSIAVLETLASQIATAIQNVNLFESSKVNLGELERLYRSSRQITQEQTEMGALEATARVLQDAPFISAIFTAGDNNLELVSLSDPDNERLSFTPSKVINISPSVVSEQLVSGLRIVDLSMPTATPNSLTNIPRQMGSQTVALLPIFQDETLYALIMLGARQKGQITAAAMQPYASMAEMITTTLDKIKAANATKRQLSEMEAISMISQTMSAAGELSSLYPALHEQVRQILGDYSFAVTLYDSASDTIRVPYLYEDGEVSSVEPFPLGEGLVSIIIRTGQPLMIVEDTERRSIALGAKMVGRPAKSWLGSPLQIGGKVIGAIVLQDLENEKSFDEEHLRFVNALSSQVSGAIHNAQLLEDSRRRAIQLQSAAEIARDISGSLHLDELLNNAVRMIRERFDFYHASIFLIDPLGEYAVIRESTGDAGAKMKRDGHKLGVGSKSIVGYVSSRGETLVIDDTDKDVTYYDNPLLPETRAEAAVPLKVGERILGVLDVQSTAPYAFSNEILQTLNILTDQLAVAVINTELFAETQEHLSQHRLLHHITTSAASGATLEAALKGAVQGLQVTLGGDRVAILMLDKERKNLEVRAAIGYSEDAIAKIAIPVGTGITGWVAANQKLLRIDNAPNDPRYIQVSANTRSELAIPLIFRNDLLGVLNVESEQIAAYDEHDEEMLGTLGGSLAAIIANARLLEQVRRQAERERMLYAVTSKIRRSTNIRTILETTAGELSKAVGARRAQVKIALDDKSEKNAPNNGNSNE